MKIIDNVLPQDEFDAIVNAFLKERSLPWFIEENVSGMGIEDHCYFTHNIKVTIKELFPLGEILQSKIFYRIKANLYPRTHKVYHHKDHVDGDFPHRGAILYLNTNNGFTVVNGTPVESVANRLLLFDPQIPHHSTTCSDQQYRANINFNFK